MNGKIMELCFDADFCRNWRAEMEHVDKATSKSRTAYVVTCPVTWASKMQMEVALSITYAELISTRKGLWTVIPLTSLSEEMIEKGSRDINSQTKVHWKCLNTTQMP